VKKLLALVWMTISFAAADACSRCTYTGPDATVVTGRSMDWMEDMHTDLWALPAGVAKLGSAEPNSVEWTSKYGSIIASGYNIGTTDGINTKGLCANLLYLSTTDYGAPKPDRKNISILNWAQYFLDNYASVDEAVVDFERDEFNMIGKTLPNGSDPLVHLAISDPTGDNAIFEYVNGKLMVYRGKEYNVMTNEPTFDKQLVLNAYWQNLKGVFLPGTVEPEDRFVRASFYLNHAEKTADEQKSIATVFSIIRNVSAPLGQKDIEGRPNIAATLWRTVADLKRKIYYFESTDRPNIFWVDISKLKLDTGSPIKKLPLADNQIYAAEVSQYFVESKPFFDQPKQIIKTVRD
jgi:choloylglycine hydrolase